MVARLWSNISINGLKHLQLFKTKANNFPNYSEQLYVIQPFISEPDVIINSKLFRNKQLEEENISIFLFNGKTL